MAGVTVNLVSPELVPAALRTVRVPNWGSSIPRAALMAASASASLSRGVDCICHVWAALSSRMTVAVSSLVCHSMVSPCVTAEMPGFAN